MGRVARNGTRGGARMGLEELERYALGLDARLRELEDRNRYLEALIRTFAGQS